MTYAPWNHLSIRLASFAVTGLSLLTGCEYRPDWQAHPVPLSIVADSPSKDLTASNDTVAVSMVFSTGWVWALIALPHPESVHYDQVSIERVDRVDPNRATLHVPRTGSGIIWGLAFLRSDNDGYAFFRPGYLPVFSTPDAWSANFKWAGSPIEGVAHVKLDPIAAATTQPSKSKDLEHLLARSNFWREMKARYATDRDTAAVRQICRSIVLAEQGVRAQPPPVRSAEQAEALEWCRSVASSSRQAR
jgi:hypothetical protein